MTVVLNQSFTGISIGAVLLLIALGLTLTFGQMGVINMAHGEFIMAGAYTTYVLQQAVGGAGVSCSSPCRWPSSSPERRAPSWSGCSSGASTPARWTPCWSPGASP